MTNRRYVSMTPALGAGRREFLKTLGAAGAVVAGRVVLGVPPAFGEEAPPPKPAPEVETNLADFLAVPRGKHAIPGPFPGKVVAVRDVRCLKDEKVDAKVVAEMFERGVTALTGQSMRKSFAMLFEKGDVVGIKVNPVGAPLIHVKPELVEAVIAWLERSGLPRRNVVIWDRFDDMLKDAGYTPERFPGVRIASLQTMAGEGKSWKNDRGQHVSAENFDREAFYLAKGVEAKDVPGYADADAYMNQHVFGGEHSYFGKLVTRELTKIVNLASFKNTGNGISCATKNLGYGAICNTGRLHQPLFFRVCTEVLAAPAVRDKLVLNVTDGIRGLYEGGPMGNEQFTYAHHTLYFATDPFAADAECHRRIVAKRKEMGIKVNEHPRFTDYLRQAEKLGLGVVDPAKLRVVSA